MINVNVNNLDSIKNQVIIMFGKEFINEIDSFETAGLNQFEVAQTYHAAHPFAIWWEIFKQDIKTSQEANELRLSEFSIRIINLFSDLIDIKEVSNFIRILNAIKRRNTFYSACFEAHVASCYINIGKNVEISEEGIIENQRVSDLKVNTKNEAVYMECKSLDDFKLKESPLWAEITIRVHNALKKYKRSWAVTILAGKQIDGKDMNRLCTDIAIDIRNSSLGERLINDYFKVSYKKLLDWNQEVRGEIAIKQNAEIGSFETEMFIDPLGCPINKNCTIVQIMPYVEFDISKRLIHEFKNAIGQIPKNGPGIIHIEIPYKQGGQLLKVIDTVYPKIYEKLNRDSSRINAVIISGAVIEHGQRTPLVYNYYVVPNNNPRAHLPDDFDIIGTNDMGVPLTDNEGSVIFTFGLKNAIESGIPSIIYEHCDRTGKHQIKVWKPWYNKLRMDIVNPTLGRVFIEAEYEGFSLNKQYIFGGTWSNKELKIFVNGEKKGVKTL